MHYMDALELMDSDYSVHVKVLELAEQMNFQPPLIETAQLLMKNARLQLG